MARPASIIRLFNEFPVLNSEECASKKQLLNDSLGAMLPAAVLNRVIVYIRMGESKRNELEWQVGHHLMGVFTAKDYFEHQMGRLADDRVTSVTDTLLELPNLKEGSR